VKERTISKEREIEHPSSPSLHTSQGSPDAKGYLKRDGENHLLMLGFLLRRRRGRKGKKVSMNRSWVDERRDLERSREEKSTNLIEARPFWNVSEL